MCNLYSMTATVDEIRRMFGPFDGDRANLPPFDEIYPGQQAPVLRRDSTGRLKLETMQWGFPGPPAAKSRPVTNVRNLQSPFWRSALVRPDRRCIVPVTRFCEWTAEPLAQTGRKAKIWFGPAEEEPQMFGFAGLWRPGDSGGFMAFLTCAANAIVAEVHPKAMPVILDGDDSIRWLDGDVADACALQRPFEDRRMRRID